MVAPSRNYQHRQIRPLGVGGENESKWKMGLLQQEEEKSMKQAHERLGENPFTGGIYNYNQFFTTEIIITFNIKLLYL